MDDGEAGATLREELGIDRPLGNLLVVDHEGPADGYPEGIAWIFDGGLITDGEVGALTLDDPEIKSVGLYTLDSAASKLKPALRLRLAVALYVVDFGDGTPAFCEDGKPVAS